MSYLRLILFVCLAACVSSTLAAAQYLSITPASATVDVGQSVRLSASAYGATWATSNPAVATVTQGGMVTGVSAGTATISAKFRNYRGYATVTVVAPPPPPLPPDPLVVSCPANLSAVSPDGSPVVVTYQATATGGVAPVSIEAIPASGSLFPVGVSAVNVTAASADGQFSSCGFNVSVTYTPTPPPPPPDDPTYGPRASITCPADAVDVLPGSSIQAAINGNVGATTFCLKAGTHPIAANITPKTGNAFVGEYGAILDGSGWVSASSEDAAFRAHNQDIDNVTIRNVVIQNMPQRGVHIYGGGASGWTIEYSEITGTRTGVNVSSGATVRNCYIHHNSRGGYLMFLGADALFEGNEIAYNGTEQKAVGTQRVTFRGNFVHHNTGDGIWFDTSNTGYAIDSNVVEDNARMGIHVEISGQGVVTNNSVSRSGDTGIMIVTSKNVETYGNTLTDNFRAIQYYLKCSVVGAGDGYDLANNATHDNTISVGTRSGSWANTLGWPSADAACTPGFVAPYLDGTKALSYYANSYSVPASTAKYWMWGQAQFKSFMEWQALGNDVAGSSALR
jgi:parallel beta-helix repeat protein